MVIRWASTIVLLSVINTVMSIEHVTSDSPHCHGATKCERVRENLGETEFKSRRLSLNYSSYKIYFHKDGQRTVDYITHYDKNQCSTVYAHVMLYGNNLTSGFDFPHTTFIELNGCCESLFQGQKATKKHAQYDMFDLQFGSEQRFVSAKQQYYIVFFPLVSGLFTGRNQLAELGTLDCNNVALMYNSVYNGNWKAVMTYVSEYVASYKNYRAEVHFLRGGTLTVPAYVEAGMYVVTTKDHEGRVHSTISVPEYYAVVLIYREYREGYIFITFNNPFIDSTYATKRASQLCPYNYYLSKVSWDTYDMTKGYSFYCYVYDFFQHNDIPIPDGPDFGYITKGL